MSRFIAISSGFILGAGLLVLFGLAEGNKAAHSVFSMMLVSAYYEFILLRRKVPS